MIKRKINITLPSLSDFVPYDFTKHNLSTYGLINDTYDFLTKYFKGTFDWTHEAYLRSYVNVSSDGFAYMMKIIFKAVKGRDLIYIKYSAENNLLVFTIDLDSTFIDEKTNKMLLKVSLESGFFTSIEGGRIEIKTRYFETAQEFLESITQRTVYKSLICIFFS